MWTIAGGIVLAILILAVGFAAVVAPLAAIGGIGKSMEESRLRRLRMHAEKGDAEAQFQLAEACYWSETEREKWYRKAAEQGHAEAEYRLGINYQCPTDEEAARWYRRAADKGHQLAQYQLAGMYELVTGCLRI